MKNLDGGFSIEKTISINGPIQILLHKSKEQEITHKLREHLNFSNTFSYFFHNYDVTSLENIQSHFESHYAKSC